MQVSHLALKDFGRFENFECDFSPGLNVVKGPNEAGKSTLADAIAVALFVDPASEQKKPPKIRWGSDHAPVLEAILDIDGESVKLTRDFERGITEIASDGPDAPVERTENVGLWLYDKTGMPSEEVFKATACINQGEIDHIEDSVEAIKDKLESLVTGGREDQLASLTIRKIRERLEAIAKDVDNAASASEGLDYNINKLKRDIEGLKLKRADLIQVETAYRNVYDDLSNKKKEYDKGKLAIELEEKAAKFTVERQKLEKTLAAARKSFDKIENLKNQKSDLKRIDPGELNELEENESSLKYLMPKSREMEKEIEEARDELSSHRIGGPIATATIFSLLATVSLSVSHFMNLLSGFYPYVWYSLGGSLAVFLLGGSVILSRKQHHNFLAGRVEKLVNKLDNLKEEIEDFKAKTADLLSRYSVTSAEEIRKNLWRHEELENQIALEEKHFSELLGGQSLEDLERKHEKANSESERIAREKDELSQYSYAPEELERSKLIIDQFEERIKDLERERTVLRQQLETAEGGAELLASYLERKKAINHRVHCLSHEREILHLTIDCIEEACQNVLRSKLEVLNARTSEILEVLTMGRYSNVRLDKSNLSFEVLSDEKGGWVDPEKELSFGTVDQIYLAARLALAELISESKNSMLILDEPFAGYDEEHLESAMKVLKKLSENYQIMLMTSQDHYDKWADSTISL